MGDTSESGLSGEKYDLLLSGVLALGSGQRRLTGLMMELAQESAEQEERIEQVINALRAMGDTATDTQKRLAIIEADVDELKRRSA